MQCIDQAPLFPTPEDNSEKPPRARIGTQALQVVALTGKLTPAQARYNKALARVEKLNTQVEAISHLRDTHRPRYHEALAPLRASQNKLKKELALFLHQRLARKGLNRNQRQTAEDIVFSIAQALAEEGDKQMQALFDKYNTPKRRKQEQAMLAETQSMMEAILGKPLKDGPVENIEELMAAGAAAAQEELRAFKTQESSRKPSKKPSAAQVRTQQTQEEAQITLRTVYRQLASALHPDRESDESERARKTALMSEANAAYERRDLLALLQLELQSARIDAQSISKMSEQKIAALTHLLTEQAQTLQDALHRQQINARQEFGLEQWETVSQKRLNAALHKTQFELLETLHTIRLDLQQIQTDAGLKAWIELQDELEKEQDFEDLLQWPPF